MAKPLIIVESPAKTRTLSNFLGGRYELQASMGHVRDLPERELGVDLDHDFAPKYVPLADRKQQLDKLKAAAKGAPDVYIATDPDREGEAIAWHLQEALKLKDPKRIEFNEITRSAVERALEHPRVIDMHRVDAQQARRVVDRLVGYQLSPLLWRKIGNRTLSAGRVQSVALRLVVEREREIRAFVTEEYWSITAKLTPRDQEWPFEAKLRSKGEDEVELKNGDQANAVLAELEGAQYVVSSIKKSKRKRTPPLPFITSTLQQEASRKLGFSAKQTMRVAQQLYEGIDLGNEGAVGLITYMRTDSTRVADEAKAAAADVITERFGKDYLPTSARTVKKGKNVQDAHEAVRPTYPSRTPESVATYLDKDQSRLYDLIWRRFIASQMADALLDLTTVDIAAGAYIFRATGSVVTFKGFTAVYTEGKDNGENGDDQAPLPVLEEEDILRLLELLPEQHFTQPPPRYTEATLVKALEQNGIGRPSTYATILSVIVERGYVKLEKRVFFPTVLGEAVCDYLVATFPTTFAVKFTAEMESDLDKVAEQKADWVAIVREFYGPLDEQLRRAMASNERVKMPERPTDKVCPNCGRPMVIKTGRRGDFIACTGFPECKTAMPIDGEERPPDKPSDKTCPDCGKPMVIKAGKRGEFLACTGYPKCKKTMPLDGEVAAPEVTDKVCPKCGKPMVVKQSRRGPFLSCSGYPKCKTAMPLEGEAAEPEVTDKACPNCGKPMVIKSGRRGKFLSCSGYPKCKTAMALEGEAPAEEPADATCPACGKPMVKKTSRSGEFLACTGYPGCKKTLPLSGRTGIPCPICADGEMVERLSRFKKVFWGCSRYPECKCATWDKPTGEKCPVCGDALVEKGGKVVCQSKSCDYVREPNPVGV